MAVRGHSHVWGVPLWRVGGCFLAEWHGGRGVGAVFETCDACRLPRAAGTARYASAGRSAEGGGGGRRVVAGVGGGGGGGLRGPPQCVSGLVSPPVCLLV